MKTINPVGGNRTPLSLCSIVIVSAAAMSFSIAAAFADDIGQQKDRDEAAIETRLRQTVEYLASDELQGRGPRTEGIDKAADYISNT